jgi:opacity protein-like surface antigen
VAAQAAVLLLLPTQRAAALVLELSLRAAANARGSGTFSAGHAGAGNNGADSGGGGGGDWLAAMGAGAGAAVRLELEGGAADKVGHSTHAHPSFFLEQRRATHEAAQKKQTETSVPFRVARRACVHRPCLVPRQAKLFPRVRRRRWSWQQPRGPTRSAT